jgi:type IV secretion system protein VirB6
VIGSLALLRIAAGLLLALAPIVAGLYFFTQSRGIFAGWLKGLVLTVAGSIGASLILSVQLAVVEPWLADAIRLRGSSYALPSAPTELFAMMLAFAIVQLVMLWLLAKVVFHRGWLTLPDILRSRSDQPALQPVFAGPVDRSTDTILRAERVSNSIENSIRREQSERVSASERVMTQNNSTQSNTQTRTVQTGGEPPRLGSSYRRTALRTSRIARLRDRMS